MVDEEWGTGRNHSGARFEQGSKKKRKKKDEETREREGRGGGDDTMRGG